MNKIRITKDMVRSLHETPYIKLFDLQYAPGKHYYNASRKGPQDLIALKSDEEFKAMKADAVTCIVLVQTPDTEPRLYLQYEYRYPTGQFLLSPPAGLMDPADADEADPLFSVTRREIFEETGLMLKDTDIFRVVNPLVFSTPGMSDESNAMTLAIIHVPDLSSLSQEGTVGTELMDGYELFTKEEALEVLKSGRDKFGNFYSIYTLICLIYYVTDLWKDK
ncbi:MAG: NUDIX hydrolase [Lachnospiraceae bacterium]|nr:NUDIX hydrolase [Lachnospiraceae bacterium]